MGEGENIKEYKLMWRWIFRIMYALAALILVASVLLYLYPPSEYIASRGQTEQTDLTTEDKGIVYAVVIDMDNSRSATKDTLRAGVDAILMLKATQDADHYIFNGLSSLLKYDDNKTSWIDAANKIFPDLELMTLSRAGERRFVGLDQSGIRAIQINPESIGKDDDTLNNQVIAQAVMTDGSRRNIYLIRIGLRRISDTDHWTIE